MLLSAMAFVPLPADWSLAVLWVIIRSAASPPTPPDLFS
jgi:hypothetical protein